MGSGSERLKTPMLSSPKNPPSKTFCPLVSLRFTHLNGGLLVKGKRVSDGKMYAPGEVHEQLLEDAFQERNIFTTMQLPLNLKDTECGPRKA